MTNEIDTPSETTSSLQAENEELKQRISELETTLKQVRSHVIGAYKALGLHESILSALHGEKEREA